MCFEVCVRVPTPFDLFDHLDRNGIDLRLVPSANSGPFSYARFTP